MNVQVIMREGQPEYAVLPWDEYQALLHAAGASPKGSSAAVEAAAPPALAELKALREARSLSLEDLARSAGISPHYLALIEQGERQPDGAIVRALARALGVPGWEAAS